MGTSKDEAIDIGQALGAFNSAADRAATGSSNDPNDDPIVLDRDIDLNGHTFLNAEGLVGEQGPAGPEGPTGPQGPQGTPGVDGSDGADGADGSDGATGPQGPPGADGSNGSDGADGSDGVDGATILTGSGAPSDGNGNDGDLYVNTANGDYYQKASGTWGSAVGNLTGPAGATGATGAQGPAGNDGADGADGATGAAGADGSDGADGATILTGAGAPSDGNGANGDLYINTSNGDLYEKSGGTWGSAIANLTGPAGADGADGADGATGATGATGAQGPQGDPGADGSDGADADIADAYPVGSIYMNATVATNPATLLGFGTWAAIGEGRVLVGKESSGTFDTAGAEVGAETDDITHHHDLDSNGGVPFWLDGNETLVLRNGPAVSLTSGNRQTGVTWAGGGPTISTSLGLVGRTANETLEASTIQPSLVVYMWVRTA